MNTLRNTVASLVALLLVAVLSAPAFSQPLRERIEDLEEKMEADEAPGDKYVDEFGGRIMADFTFNVDGNSNLYSGSAQDTEALGIEPEDGFEFRRTRLYAEGPIGQNIDYKLQLDFGSGGEVDLKSVYMSYDDMPFVDDLKVGKFKEAYSINEQTSSKYITFMSRSALTDALSQARQVGAQTTYSSPGDQYNVKVGVFNPQEDQNADPGNPGTNGSYDLAGRLTSPVTYENNGRKVVHLGVSARESAEQSGRVDIDVEPEVHKGDPEFLEVDIPAENSTTYGLEAATVRGPLSAQAEWSEQDVSTPGGSDVSLESWYIMGSYFITGEHRPYSKADGDFGRIDVRDEWRGGQPTNSGAWELAARWSKTDFTDAQGGINTAADGRDIDQSGPGGTNTGTPADQDALASEMDVLTIGANWYPHEHAKWMINYVDAEQDALDGDAQWVTTRYQVDF